jgi:hypothetical protein
VALLNEIQVGRYNGVLHKLLDIKDGAPAPQLAADIQPGLILENDRPEWKFLGGEHLCAGVGRRSATALQFSTVWLWNPMPSRGVIIVVEKVIISATTASGTNGQVHWGHIDALIGGGTQVEVAHGFRDARLARGNQASAGQVYVAGPAASGDITAELGSVFFGGDSQTVLTIENMNYILMPQTGLGFQSGAVQENLTVAFQWRERQVESSELR